MLFAFPGGAIVPDEEPEGGTVNRTRHPRKDRPLYPVTLPSYLQPPALREVVFDPSLRRAGEALLGT